MKKTMMAVLLMYLLILSTVLQYGTVDAATENVRLITVYVDGEKVELDTDPIISNNRTLVPLRGVFEKLGATVDWNMETKQAIIKNDAIEVLLEIGNKGVLLNGEIQFLDTYSRIQNDRTLIPIRFVAESLGHDVQWDAKNFRVLITTKKTTEVTVNKELPVIGSSEALNQLLRYNEALNTYITNRFFVNDVMEELAAPVESKSDAAVSTPSNAVSESSQTTQGVDSNDFSNTNNQTLGVDEGDIIKTNGRNIFSLNQNRVHILSTDPQKPQVLSTIEVADSKGYVTDIYLNNDILVVIGNSNRYSIYPILMEKMAVSSVAPYYNTTGTFVLTYDVQNPAKPSLVKDYSFDGSYVSSRLVANKLYMITNQGFYNWLQQDVVPKYTNNMTGDITTLDYKDIRYFPDYITPNFMLTIGLDLQSEQLDVKAYLGSAESVYASNDNIYLTLTNYEYGVQTNAIRFAPNYEKTTSVYKFSYKEGVVDYVARGSVKGSILNQFSLDEFNGNLRMATTSGEIWNEENVSKNHIIILNKDLKIIGTLSDLAPGERIYSTRFAGNRIYMVTFRQVDPFFVIDATDPTMPKVLGDLKIPGFSTYMHILDENHILGFGSETIETDGRVTVGGLKISLFDVPNPQAPVEKTKQVIGAAGTNSEIQYNHKALMISLDKGIMAFPISVTSVPYVNAFSGAYVYKLSTDSFSYMGNITHQDSTTVMGEDTYKYFDYNYNINRIVYIGDYLYSLSGGKMQVTSISSMNKTGEVKLPEKVYSIEGPIYSLPVIN